MASITCGNCKRTHESVEAVKTCYSNSKNLVGRIPSSPVEAMIYAGVAATRREARAQSAQKIDPHTVPLFTIPSGPTNRDANGQTEVGFYRVGVDIYRVTSARASVRSFAHKLFVMTNGKCTWRYVGLASSIIKPDAPKLTLAEAAEFGKAQGYCLVCGRQLTDTNSIAAGIGPVCAQKIAA